VGNEGGDGAGYHYHHHTIAHFRDVTRGVEGGRADVMISNNLRHKACIYLYQAGVDGKLAETQEICEKRRREDANGESDDLPPICDDDSDEHQEAGPRCSGAS
jgi:hypothetical protein